eukprot:808093-Pelagomonas_calceolata.AAC.1
MTGTDWLQFSIQQVYAFSILARRHGGHQCRHTNERFPLFKAALARSTRMNQVHEGQTEFVVRKVQGMSMNKLEIDAPAEQRPAEQRPPFK